MIRTMSGMVIAETSTSLPRGNRRASSKRSKPLRTDRHASVCSGLGHNCSTLAATVARSGGKQTRQTPNSRSDQPMSSLFRDHMMQPQV